MYITQANLKHVELFVKIFEEYRAFYKQLPDFYTSKSFLIKRIAREESVIFLAFHDQTEKMILGFTQLYPSYSSVYLHKIWILNDLFVEESSRLKGIGRALLQTAKEHAEKTDVKTIVLKTETINQKARKLYESEGYIQDHEFSHYSLSVLESNLSEKTELQELRR